MFCCEQWKWKIFLKKIQIVLHCMMWGRFKSKVWDVWLGTRIWPTNPHLFGKSKTKYDFCGSGLPYRRWLKMWWCITEGLASQGCLDSNGAGLPMQWDRVREGKRRIFYPKQLWHEFGNVWHNKFWIKCHIIIFDPKKIMADFWGYSSREKNAW